MPETKKDLVPVLAIAIAAAVIMGGGLITVDGFRTPREVQRLYGEVSEAKRIVKGKVDSGWATQGDVEWSWLNGTYTINLDVGSLLPGDARELARFVCETARSGHPYWSRPWSVQVYLANGSRPAARCEI
jgi:hypothetical protein